MQEEVNMQSSAAMYVQKYVVPVPTVCRSMWKVFLCWRMHVESALKNDGILRSLMTQITTVCPF